MLNIIKYETDILGKLLNILKQIKVMFLRYYFCYYVENRLKMRINREEP